MKRFFLGLSQFGAFTLTAFGGFYTRIAPPQDTLKFWPGYASLVAGIVFLVVANLSKKVRSVIFWISAVLAVIFPISYYVHYQNRTATYGQDRVICGTVYTVKGSEYSARNPGITREELIKDFAGQTAEIWTEDSINKAGVTLGLLYALAVALLGFTVAIKLQDKKPPKALP
jgi:hypothetical protein